MCDSPMDIVKNVVLNVATGGLYSIGKAVLKTIDTGNPTHLLTQGLDMGMASLGNQLAVDIGGPKAGMAFNAAGGALGALGSAGAFSSLPGFTPGGGAAVTPLATSSSTALAPEAANVVGGTGVKAIASGAPGVTAPAGSTLGTLAPEAANVINGAGTSQAAAALTALQGGASVSSLSPAMQMALVMVGGQLVTGSLGGLFNGLSAQKKLDLEKLINEQTQNQVQYKNKNNTYVPKLKFAGATPPAAAPASTGMINTGRV
ncbi:MAG: hypothetical protein ABIU97_07350 [Dehalococcoidia bacterium]